MNESNTSYLLRIKRSGFSNIFVNLLIKGSAVLSAPIFTRLLTPADYGITSIFFAWTLILSVFVNLGMQYSLGNARNEFSNFEYKEFINAIKLLVSLVWLFFFGIIFVFRKDLPQFIDLSEELILLMSVYIIFLFYYNIFLEKLRFELDYKKTVLISLFIVFFNIILGIVLIKYIFPLQGYWGRILGLTLPTMSIALIPTINFRIPDNGKKILDYWRYALKISLPMIPHSISMLIISQIDRIMILDFLGENEAGLYSLGASYAFIISGIGSAIMQPYLPFIFKKYNENKLDEIQFYSKKLVLILSLLGVLSVLWCKTIISFLVSSDFFDSYLVVLPLIFFGLTQFLYSILSSFLIVKQKNFLIAIGSFISVVINIILNFMLIKNYGIVGAAYATLASYIFLILYFSWLNYQILDVNIGQTYLVLIILSFYVLTLIVLQIQNQPIINILLSFIIAPVIYITLKKRLVNVL